MAMNRAVLRDAVKKGIASRSDVTDTEINTYLDLSQERIARQKNWHELEQKTDISLTAVGTAAADKEIDISSLTNLKDIYSVVIENDVETRKLVRLNPSKFEENIPLPEYFDRDTPEVYTQWGTDTLITHPVVDQAYTMRVRWFKWPTALASDSTSSDLVRKDDMLIFLTLSFVFALLREEEQASKFFRYYQNELRMALNENDEVPDLRITPGFFARGGHKVPYHLDAWNNSTTGD